MTFWSGLFGAGGDGAAMSRNPSDDFWFREIGPSTSSGVPVDHENALRATTVYACVRAIAETIAALPLIMYQRQPNGDKTRTDAHPLAPILHDRANDEQTAIEWREQILAWALMRGTAISEKVPGSRGAIAQLVPLHPDIVRPKLVEDGQGRRRWNFEVRERGAPMRVLLRDEVHIVRGINLGVDAVCGLDPIMVEAQTIGAALAADDYAGRLFANSAVPLGIIKHPGHFRSQDDRNVFKRAWDRAFGGSSRHRTAVLEHGMEYQAVSMTPEQSQFLETRQYHAVDICRIFRVPPHKAQILDRATWGNLEQQNLEWLSDTLVPWIVRLEQSILRDLIATPGFFAEHNVAGVLRADLRSRYEAFAIGRNWGWLSVNEIRRIENMNGVGELGDEYLRPLNMTPAGQPGDPSGMTRRETARAAPGALQAHEQLRSGLWQPSSYRTR